MALDPDVQASMSADSAIQAAIDKVCIFCVHPQCDLSK
jgi:hypothetical protein